MTKQARWHRRNPWVRYRSWAIRRCKDRKSKWFPYYGAKGIECRLTVEETKRIWMRDRAFELKRPSLDRVDPAGHYEAGNCRFIEFDLNSRMAWDMKSRTTMGEYVKTESYSGGGDERENDF